MSLTDLIINESDPDESLLEKLVEPFIRIAKDTGKVMLTPRAVKLNVKQKVLVYLLGRKAARLIGSWQVQESAYPSEMAGDSGIPGGSLRPNLMDLHMSGLVMKDKESKYFVPNHVLPYIGELLKSSGEEEENIPF